MAEPSAGADGTQEARMGPLAALLRAHSPRDLLLHRKWISRPLDLPERSSMAGTASGSPLAQHTPCSERR